MDWGTFIILCLLLYGGAYLYFSLVPKDSVEEIGNARVDLGDKPIKVGKAKKKDTEKPKKLKKTKIKVISLQEFRDESISDED